MTDSLILNKLRSGCVIPAHPLALKADNRIDERHQRALTRYYLAAGAGGLAVGVHTPQFAIHEPKIGLYRPVLELAIETARQFSAHAEPIMIAGIVGDTKQAIQEAHLANELGYRLGLLSLKNVRKTQQLVPPAPTKNSHLKVSSMIYPSSTLAIDFAWCSIRGIPDRSSSQ